MKKNIDLSLRQNDYANKRILIISTKWNEEIIQPMLDDCKKSLTNMKANFSEIIVPGAFEIPFMVNNKAKSYDAVITLGAIIKGETPHFDIIAQSISDQIISLNGEAVCIKPGKASYSPKIPTTGPPFEYSAINAVGISATPD